MFEVCRQRPAPFPSNFSCWSSSALECRETSPLARVCCQEPKPGPRDVPGTTQLSPRGESFPRWLSGVPTKGRASREGKSGCEEGKECFKRSRSSDFSEKSPDLWSSRVGSHLGPQREACRPGVGRCVLTFLQGPPGRAAGPNTALCWPHHASASASAPPEHRELRPPQAPEQLKSLIRVISKLLVVNSVVQLTPPTWTNPPICRDRHIRQNTIPS